MDRPPAWERRSDGSRGHNGARCFETERQRREELDRREYELFLRSGLSTTSSQAAADEQALIQAKGQRDQQLISALNERTEALKAQPGNGAAIDSSYQEKVRQIRQNYETERARILGMGPTTQPGE